MRAAGNERTVEFPAAFYFTKQVLLLTKNLFSFIMTNHFIYYIIIYNKPFC